MSNFNKLLSNTFTKKYWHNTGLYCDRKRHPTLLHRGKNRCLECGCKIGIPKMERYAYREKLVDNVFCENPILKILKGEKE